MLRKTLIHIILILAFAAVGAQPGLAGEEVYRIRVCNKTGGLVMASMNGGNSYCTVGRVMVAANSRIVGFAAASYTPQGTVAATAIHGIRIKTGQFANGVGKAQMPLMFSIIPLEFAVIPRGYGGHTARSSGIHTDIYSGHSIFRNESPFVGNAVFLEEDHLLKPLPEDYTPVGGEVFVVVVKRPDDAPREVDLENIAHGKVTVKHADGSLETIAEVESPVRGTGRYDGTTFTGVGAVNTNHGGVLTISTAPTCLPMTLEGGSVETRGGFMIQPFYHVWEQGEASPQVMVVGPRDKKRPHMEGTPPLFDGCINLSRFVQSPEHSYRAQVRIDDGQWEDVPKILGKVDDAFTPKYLQEYFAKAGKARQVSKGVTAVRLLFAEYSAKLTAQDLARETNEYAARALLTGMKPLSGTLSFAPAKSATNCIVSFYVDGNQVYTSNEYPYACRWDSTTVSNGLHEVEIETTRSSASAIVKQSYSVLIMNHPAQPATSASASSS